MTEVQSRLFASEWTLQRQGELSTIHRPLVMGILNVTPDSFHDGGQFNSVEKALERAGEMLAQGADLLDIGGASSRPGAPETSLTDELDRSVPIIKAVKAQHPQAFISIDTWRAEVAQQAVEAGADMVNDISAGSMDPNLLPTVAELGVPYVLMHMQGRPEHMQDQPDYQNVEGEVMHFFSKKINTLIGLGVKDIIIDPGFGFGKSLKHNYRLLNHLEDLKIFERPVLVGMSRKRMVCEPLGIGPSEALNGTSVLNTLALQKGANILRVHDVREAVECVKLHQLTLQKE